jgi:hypothetical protein
MMTDGELSFKFKWGKQNDYVEFKKDQGEILLRK